MPQSADQRIIELDVRTDEMLVNMGPQHPSTHGVLRLVLRTDGEIVHEVIPHLGYLHRCAEKIGEHLAPPQWVPYTDRMDYLAAMNMNLGFSLTVEKLMSQVAPPKAQLIRVFVAELNRIASHLLGMGAYGLDLGSFTPFLYGFREREIILDLLEEVCGARLTYSYVTPGGVTHDLPEAIPIPPGLAMLTGRPAGATISWVDAVILFLDWLGPRIDDYHTLLTENHIFVQRTAGLGVLTREKAISYGCSGPVLRGSGVEFDLRRHGDKVYTSLYEKFEFDIPTAPFRNAPREVIVGDNWCRFYVRMLEVTQSMRILRQAADLWTIGGVAQDLAGHKIPYRLTTKLPAAEVYLETECPRGQMGFYVIGNGAAEPLRTRAKSSSFCNLSVISELCQGVLLADIPSIAGSLDIVMGEIDR
jgi:NADH-quinone oxidoreductase subunit D